MNNLIAAIKRFFSNKNTVTIIGIIVGVLVLYIGYNWRISQELKTIRIPYAKTTLTSRHTITAEDIGYMEVPESVLKKQDNLIKKQDLIVGMQVKYNANIPANSFFYNNVLVTAAEQPGYVLANIPDNYRAFTLDVYSSMTHISAMIPGTYIDLYISGKDLATDKLVSGRLIKSIEILAVLDKNENVINDSGSDITAAAQIVFAVTDEMADLLEKARLLTSQSIKIIPIARNTSYSASPGETIIDITYLRDMILAGFTVLPGSTTNYTQ